MTASPQQMHALVQVIRYVLLKHIPISEEERFKLIQLKNALVNLAELEVPYKTKKQTLVQESSGFIEDLLTPILSSLEFLMLEKQWQILKSDHLSFTFNAVDQYEEKGRLGGRGTERKGRVL